MTQQANTNAEDLLTAARVPLGSNEQVAPPVPAEPRSNVQIIQIDGRRLDIRDGEGHGWLMPIENAVDLVRWWVEQGRMQTPWGGLAPQQRFGQVWVSILSDQLVYVRGADAQGRATITGFLFPRAVVEALATAVVLQERKDQSPSLKN
jgi:hypothetical protein